MQIYIKSFWDWKLFKICINQLFLQGQILCYLLHIQNEAQLIILTLSSPGFFELSLNQGGKWGRILKEFNERMMTKNDVIT